MGSKKKGSGRVACVDGAKCTLCEVCVRHCPTKAYRIDRDGKTVRLLFSYEVCSGCEDQVPCVDKCPEKAIAFKPRKKSSHKEEQMVAEAPMLQCAYCGEHFSSAGRVESVSRRLTKNRQVERSYCPLCRRTRLVVNLIEERRQPGAKAEYRSGKDMLRRAEERKKTKS